MRHTTWRSYPRSVPARRTLSLWVQVVASASCEYRLAIIRCQYTLFIYFNHGSKARLPATYSLLDGVRLFISIASSLLFILLRCQTVSHLTNNFRRCCYDNGIQFSAACSFNNGPCQTSGVYCMVVTSIIGKRRIFGHYELNTCISRVEYLKYLTSGKFVITIFAFRTVNAVPENYLNHFRHFNSLKTKRICFI
jgi:hypothetical protein